MDNSIEIKDTSARRVGVSEGEFVVLDKTTSGEYHAHVRTCDEIRSMPGGQGDKILTAMYKSGLIDKKGNPLK